MEDDHNHDLEKNLRKRECVASTPMIVLPSAPPKEDGESKPRLTRTDSQDSLLPMESNIDDEEEGEEKKIDNRERDRERRMERRDGASRDS